MASGGKAPKEQTITQTSIPSWAQPYATQMLGQAQALTDINQNPYQAYNGQRVAGFSGLQNQAFNGLQSMAPSADTANAAGMSQLAGLAALNYGGGNYYNSPTYSGGYQSAQAPSLNNYQMSGPGDVQSSSGALNTYQMSGPGNVRTRDFNQMAADQYMSPYMRNVLDSQKKNAVMDYARALPQLGAAATQVGGLGGTRSALMQSEANRNLQSQLQDIESTGMQSAYNNAQQQFNTDQARRLQAAQGNQQTGYNVGAQNLAAALGVQQLGAGQDLQAQMANQQARYNTNAQNLAAMLGVQQLGAGQDMQAQLANQQAGLTSNQQQNQFGLQNANQAAQYGLQSDQLGLQGILGSLQGFNNAGALGNQAFQQQMGINNAQLAAGQQQQQNQQQNLNALYQQFLDQQNYPYKQLGFMSDLVHGLPSTNTTNAIYGGSGNTLGQAVGLAGGLGSLFAGGG